MSNKYIFDFYIFDFDDKETLRHSGQWGVVDLSRKGKTGAIGYAPRLKDLLHYRQQIKNCAFFQLGFSGPAFYIPIDLYNPKTKEKITIIGALDSGASLAAFSYEIADAISINWQKGKRIKATLGEKYTPLYVNRVKLLMGSLHIKQVWPIEADIINEKKAANLIGVYGFFNKFEIIFNPKFGLKYRFV